MARPATDEFDPAPRWDDLRYDDDGNPILTPGHKRMLDAMSNDEWRSLKQMVAKPNGSMHKYLRDLVDIEMVVSKLGPHSARTGARPMLYRKLRPGEVLPLFEPPPGMDVPLFAQAFGGYTFNQVENVVWHP